MTPDCQSPKLEASLFSSRNFNSHGPAEARQSFAARHLQLHTDDAVAGARLTRSGETQDAYCWLCGEESQTVAHLLRCTASGEDSVTVCCGSYALTTP